MSRQQGHPNPFGCYGLLLALLVSTMIDGVFMWLGMAPGTAAAIGLVIGVVVVLFLVYWVYPRLTNRTTTTRIRRRTIAPGVRQAVFQRDGGSCVRCGATTGLEIDHIIPVSRGGSDTEKNLQVLCSACNRSKGNRYIG
jgi:hypothetical protein